MKGATVTYQAEVKAAAAALKRGEDANWELARLTFENTKSPGDTKTRAGVTMAQWCADVSGEARRDFGVSTGWLYKQIWAKHGLGASRRPWPEAYDDVRGAGSIRVRNADLDAARFMAEGSAAKKREVFRSLARDPEIADDVVEVVAKSPRLTAQVKERYADLHPLPERQEYRETLADPRGQDFAWLIGVSAEVKGRVRDAAERVNALVAWARKHRGTDESAEALRENIEELREAGEMCRRYAAELELAMGGKASDGWLRAVLNGEK